MKNIYTNKKADFNFVLLFAIVAGTAILVLAIYGAVKFGIGLRMQGEAEISKSIEFITDPLQAGFAGAGLSKIIFSRETIIENYCSYSTGFGENEIGVKQKSSIGEKWSETVVPVSITNKYIFSSNSEEGKTFYVFSKQFYSAFKVADLIFISSRSFCFVSPPEEIYEELSALNSSVLRIDTGIETQKCEENSIKVCFAGGCDSEKDIIVEGV